MTLLAKNLSPKNKIRIREQTLDFLSLNDKKGNDRGNESSEIFRKSEPVFLKYQSDYAREILNGESLVTVVEKSRRIGLSWADAFLATIQAAKTNGCSHFYVGYNYEMAEQYIKDCAFWAKALNLVCSNIDIKVIDESESILSYRIKFLSGNAVIALSSRPNNLRSKKGNITIDEAAFHQDFGEIIKSSLAACIWGYNVRFISTHNGISSEFNQLCNSVKNGDKNYNHLRITFKDAVKDGLAKRVLKVQGKEYSDENERKWVEEIYDIYGINSTEELDCIPSDYRGGGKIFRQEYFQDGSPVPGEQLLIVSFYDFAGTAKEFSKNSYYTARVKVAYSFADQIKYILEAEARQLDPSDSIEWVKKNAFEDGYDTLIRWEEEGGSSGLYASKFLKDELSGFDADGIKPSGNKIFRAKPVASQLKRGSIKLTDFPFKERFIKLIYQFDGTPQPEVNDLTDAFSGAIAFIDSEIPASMLFT